MDRSTGIDQEQQSGTSEPGAAADQLPAYVDRGELVASIVARHAISEPAADAFVRIGEALRATSDEYPELSEEDAIAALRSIEAAVRHAGVPRRRTGR